MKAVESIEAPDPTTFPAPLILPDDDLAFDPTYPAQSFRSWPRKKDRNEVTPERRIIYIARPPDVNSEVEFMKGWGALARLRERGKKRTSQMCSNPMWTLCYPT